MPPASGVTTVWLTGAAARPRRGLVEDRPGRRGRLASCGLAPPFVAVLASAVAAARPCRARRPCRDRRRSRSSADGAGRRAARRGTRSSGAVSWARRTLKASMTPPTTIAMSTMNAPGAVSRGSRAPCRNRPTRPPFAPRTSAAPTMPSVGDREAEQRVAPALRLSPFQVPAGEQQHEREQPAHGAEPRREHAGPPAREAPLPGQDERDERHRAQDEQRDPDDRAHDLGRDPRGERGRRAAPRPAGRSSTRLVVVRRRVAIG